jgi:hypothetical protein
MARVASQAVFRRGSVLLGWIFLLLGTSVMGYMPTIHVPSGSRVASLLRPPSVSRLSGCNWPGRPAIALNAGHNSFMKTRKLASLRMTAAEQPSVRAVVDLLVC